jgi:transposase
MTSRLQLGIDFSTKSADVCLLDGAGQRLVSHQRFSNSVPGYQSLKQLLLETLSAQAGSRLAISGEATGMYWLPFFLQLARDPELTAHGTQLYLLNPRWVAWYKKCFAPRDKSDVQDAYYIADHQRLHPATHSWEPDLATLALRTYTRFRFHLVQDLAREKSFYCAYLFLKANAYQRLQPFSDVFGATSRLVLGQAVSLDDLAALPVHDLAAKLTAMSPGYLRDPLRNATRLQRVARESFPLPEVLALPVQRILAATLELIQALEVRIREVEGWISAELAAFPSIRQLATIPGIGPACSAGIGAEILPLDRFFTAPKWDARRRRYRPRNLRDVEDAVAKLAGLWWPRAQSGDFEAEERHMSKAGNAYLRYYLIQGADQLRKYEPHYRRYYQRKYRETLRFKHKRALVLTARKSVGLCVGLLHRNEPYRSPEVQRTT